MVEGTTFLLMITIPILRLYFQDHPNALEGRESRFVGQGCIVQTRRGFSFREYLNLMSGASFPAYSFVRFLENHQEIAKQICDEVRPLAFFPDYFASWGFYPYFSLKSEISENLLKTMNMMLEVDVLYINKMKSVICLN